MGDSKLLGSTNKAEVLENMEFSRIAWEYQFDGGEMPHSNIVTYSSDIPHARVDNSVDNSIKTILQLIWLIDCGSRQRTSLTPAGVAIAICTMTRCRIWSRRSRLIGLRRIRSSVSPHSFFILTIYVLASFAGIDGLFLCRLTYDATLTEPTSLKKMRAMKDNEQIHLAISKPWQVCLSPLSIPP